MHRLEQVGTSDVDVQLLALALSEPGGRVERVLGDDKAEPAGIGRETADDEVHLVAHAETIAANLHEFASGDERFQLPLECDAFLPWYPKNLGKLSSGCGMVNAVADEL
jgi:hypothetical protein